MPTPAEPFVFKSLDLEQQDAKGRPAWNLKSPEARYDIVRQLAQARQPRGTIYKQGRPHITIRARSGTVIGDGQAIQLEGDVQITLLGANPVRITGDQVRWIPSQDLMVIDRAPAAIDRRTRIQAGLARYRIKADQLELRGTPVLEHWQQGAAASAPLRACSRSTASCRAAASTRVRSATQPRSLSALVWAFASEAQGPKAPDLIHHNLFFTEDPAQEFGPIGAGRMPAAPTLYLCAEDRARGPATGPATGPERFEIILNAPAGLPALRPEDFRQCRQITFDRLSRMGLHLTAPGPEALTTPATLDRLFPASQGAIYGRSPEGTMASFQRPPARTALPGLYLAGGGAHPGAGVPMALTSGQHAAAAVLADLTSGSRSAPMAMPGGMSMESRMTERARSR